MKITGILYLVLFLFAASCTKKTYHYVPESRKLVYSQSNKLIYENNIGIIDTLSLDEITSGLQAVDASETEYVEGISYFFSKIHEPCDTCNLRITVSYNQIGLYWFNSTYEMYYFFENDEKTFIDTCILKNNHTYYDVIKIPNYIRQSGDTMLYSLKYGVIEFVDQNKEKWQLNNFLKK
jgi:hypothetical protein